MGVAMLIWTYFVAVVASVPAGKHRSAPHIEKGSVAFGHPADFAQQLHIAHTSLFSGPCLFAVQRYHCAATSFSQGPVKAWSPCTRSLHCDGCTPVMSFDHCKRTADVVDVGSLVDYPRHHCGQAQSAAARVRTCAQTCTHARACVRTESYHADQVH